MGGGTRFEIEGLTVSVVDCVFAAGCLLEVMCCWVIVKRPTMTLLDQWVEPSFKMSCRILLVVNNLHAFFHSFHDAWSGFAWFV